MERVFINEIKKMKRARDEIEEALGVRINLVDGEVEIESKEEDGMAEYFAKKILEAIDFGFKPQAAMQLKSEDYMFEKISIKDYARASRLQTIKGRIIGKEGRAKGVIEELTDCTMHIKDYNVGIIGKTCDVDVALNAVRNMILGLPHAKIYAYLEKSRKLRKERFEEEDSLK